MLSEEEKKAIDELKEEINKPVEVPEDRFNTFILYNIESAKIVLNLIKKQSKEIEELKEKTKKCEYYEMVADELYKNSVSKDKIKEILEIEEKIDNEKLLSLLQTIVDENARLEDIEDRKVQIEYNNVFNKGVKSVEDKIKAKIEELQDDIKYSANPLSIDNSKFGIKVLQSLLEKE